MFTDIPVTPSNVDRWIVRTSIFRQIRGVLPLLNGRLLDVGCGRMPYREEILRHSAVEEYIGLDIAGALKYKGGGSADITWDGVTMPLGNASFDCALATEVFEHVLDIRRLLREVRRVLKPGGKLYFTTPFVWPYHEVPNDCQRWTAFGLRMQLEAAGFRDVQLTSRGNWHSALAQMLGLWVARAPLNRLTRAILRRVVFVAQRVLMRYDGDSQDVEQAMPRLVCGSAAA